VVRSGSTQTESTGYSIRAVQRVCDILDHLRSAPAGAPLPDLSSVLHMPKSSTFRYLVTLESRHYVERDVGGAYRLGPAFLPIQQHQVGILVAQARPYLEQVHETVGETAALGVLDGARVRTVDAIESPRAIRLTVRQGEHGPLHATAMGKAIGATLPDEQVRALLHAAGMPRLTDRTITDVERYLAELAEVRRRGFAVDDGETETDGRSVAVAMVGTPVAAALSLGAPASRFPLDRVADFAERLHRLSAEFAATLPAPRDGRDPGPAGGGRG
jgi:IclR family transcriptional regulator, acetate operon repressor